MRLSISDWASIRVQLAAAWCRLQLRHSERDDPGFCPGRMTRAQYTSKGKPKTGFESSVVANPEGAAYASSGLVILDFFFLI